MRSISAALGLFVVGSCSVAARVGLPTGPAAAPAAPVSAPAPVARVAPAAAAAPAASPIEKPAPLNLPPPPKKYELHAHSAKAKIKRTPGAYEVDDVVLARREWSGIGGAKHISKDWTPGTILKVSGDTVSMKFFSDDESQDIPASRLKTLEWKAKTKISCIGARGAGRVVDAPTGEEVRVAYINPEEEKTWPIVACTEDPHWHDTLSESFTTMRAKYKKLDAPPKSVSDEPPSRQVAGAFLDWVTQAEGGGYLKVQRCYVTSSWQSLAVGNRQTARRASAQCVAGVPAREDARMLEACLVMYGACRQKYLGGMRFAGCTWDASDEDYKTIDCDKVK